MKRLILLITLLSICRINIAHAQSLETKNSIGQVFISDFEHFLDVGFGLIKSPTLFTEKDYYTTVGITAATTLLFPFDKNIRTFALLNKSTINDKLFYIDEYYGSSYTALFTASIYGYGLFTNNNSIRKLGLNASEALIYSVAITSVLKVLFGRQRPFVTESNLKFEPFQFNYYSLPSGHSTVAFAVSTVMANYSQNIYWKLFWYSSAGLVGFSRIYHNEHWASDVFLGAAIGYFVGEFVTNFDSNNSQILGLHVNTYFTFDKVGLILRF